MSELLFVYTAIALIRMPLQENYWFWKVIGFAGLGVFQARWIVQWLYSEKHKESKVPPAFWWLSLAGALLETCYFLRQADSVGIAGYCVSAVPYTRNLMLVYGKKRRDLAAAPSGFTAVPDDTNEL
jgi:lipid-A-disaccharide synthase-like uncharacterized protein